VPTLESSKLFGDSTTPKQMQPMSRMSKVSSTLRDEQKEQKMKRAEEIKR